MTAYTRVEGTSPRHSAMSTATNASTERVIDDCDGSEVVDELQTAAGEAITSLKKLPHRHLRLLLLLTTPLLLLLTASILLNVFLGLRLRHSNPEPASPELTAASPPPPPASVVLPPRRVAHCVAGHARTLWFPEIYTLYKANVLDALGPNVEHTLYLVTDNSGPEFSHGSPYEHWPKEEYDAAIGRFNFSRVVWTHEPHNYSHMMGNACGYSRWRICLALIEETEQQRGFVFDRVIRSRPDLAVVGAIPRYDQLPVNLTLLPPYYEHSGNLPASFVGVTDEWKRGAWGDLTGDGMGVNDLFAILPRSAATVYLNTSEITRSWSDEQVARYCGLALHACECRPKVALRFHEVPYEAAPFQVKIRRSFAWCAHYRGGELGLPTNMFC